ncbi:head maturation protease, ClpP-related [Paenibacillus sp. Dod16]|uniref:head maturation protease, ClpP-related n=1 Tax=Paenibacillus sp. Dod16 TaxID=3416392 RepID=UPI003CF3432C
MAKVNIKGPIISSDEQWIYDWFEIEATSPKSVAKEIEAANGGDLEVDINSGGGSVFAGSEIYTALKSHKGNVTVRIVGLAASAASVIAMAGKKITMAPTAQMMIHNVSTRASGDYRDMEHMAGILKSANETIANAYRLKSGMTQEELLGMMDTETWLTPQQALNYKLIDEVMFENEVQLVASFGQSQMLPNEVIEKIRNTIKDPLGSRQLENKADFLMQQKANAQLKLLKLRGDERE